MLNDNWDKIDGKVAILGPDGKILSEQLPQQSFPTASTTQAGIVKLNTSTNSTSTSEAATPSAVKEVNDKVNEHSADTTKHVTQTEKDAWNATQAKANDIEILYWMGAM
ncbi:MAG: phage tail protein [Anoxybacillus ayderensis]|nr:phage tail protein [Anoxybacillus ayderensis]